MADPLDPDKTPSTPLRVGTGGKTPAELLNPMESLRRQIVALNKRNADTDGKADEALAKATQAAIVVVDSHQLLLQMHESFSERFKRIEEMLESLTAPERNKT